MADIENYSTPDGAPSDTRKADYYSVYRTKERMHRVFALGETSAVYSPGGLVFYREKYRQTKRPEQLELLEREFSEYSSRPDTGDTDLLIKEPRKNGSYKLSEDILDALLKRWPPQEGPNSLQSEWQRLHDQEVALRRYR